MDKTMKKGLLLFSLMTIASLSLKAQTLVLGSVDEAISYASVHNPDVKIYEFNQEKAHSDYKVSTHYWMPDISANFQGRDNIDLPVTPLPGEIFGQPGQTIDAQFGKKYTYDAGVLATKSLLDIRSRLSSKIAQINVEIAEANSKLYQQKLTEQVALYYYTLIISQRALEVQQEDELLVDSVLSLVNQKFTEGIVDLRAVNLAKISMNNIRQNINSYQAVIDQCTASLKILFGVEAATELVFNEKLSAESDSLQAVTEIGPDLTLDVQARQLTYSEKALKFEKAQLYPKISISAYLGAQQYRDDFGLSFDKNDISSVTYLGLNVSIPIFTGFATKNKIKSARIGYESSIVTLEKEKEKSQINDMLLTNNYHNSLETASLAKENYLLGKENADLSFQNYEQGLISFDSYYNSFDEYMKAETAYLNALSDSYTYYATLLSRKK